MIIFSNDYRANLPGTQHPAKGGPANFAKRFKNYLRGTGHNWVGLLIEFNATKQSKLEKIGIAKGVKYFQLDIPGTLARKIGRTPKKIDPVKLFDQPINLIADLLKEVKPEVIFLNGYAVSNWLILKAAQKEGIPVAIQHAGMWTKELGLYKDFYSLAGRRLMEQMEAEIPKTVAAEIFLNDWSRRYFNKYIAKTNPRKTHVVPLPVDFNNYQDINNKKAKSKIFDIGIIARWDRIKNHEAVATLAEQARKLKLPWKFHSVTIIPDTNKKKRLKDLYRKNIELVPPLDQKGIKKFCQRMDLLILPSHFDVSPNVVLEATGCKTPIAISGNVGFVDAYKKYGAKQWVIDFNNTNSAIKKIKVIVGQPMPSRLRSYIFSNHSSEKIFNKYMELFKQIIKK